MSNFYYATIYKNKIINLLLKNRDFVKLINPPPSECIYLDDIDIILGGEWIYDGVRYKEQGCVFDYDFVKDTTNEVKTFVFVETDIEYVHRNVFTDFNLYVCIFTDKELVRITEYSKPSVTDIKDMGYFAATHANRVDVLCDIVDRTLNGNEKLPGLGTIKPAEVGFCSLYCPNNKYYGKRLKYNITNLNESEDFCGD